MHNVCRVGYRAAGSGVTAVRSWFWVDGNRHGFGIGVEPFPGKIPRFARDDRVGRDDSLLLHCRRAGGLTPRPVRATHLDRLPSRTDFTEPDLPDAPEARRQSPRRLPRQADARAHARARGRGRRGRRRRLFVVHQHAARRLHFDLRLEMEGVLRSWAVPKGPSYDQAEKRLAVHVEDHPLEYGDFEGMIPAGNYGAGAVIVWDRGAWTPIGDPAEGLEKGKLLFELEGYKLHGLWTLVKLKKSQNDWLLIKERDEWTSAEPDAFAAESVLSGLTVEDLGAGTRSRGGHPTRADPPRCAATSSRRGRGEAHARRDGRAGVLARRLAVRAQARRLSGAGRAGAERAPAAHPERQRLLGELSRGAARGRRAAVRPPGARRRSRGARRPGPSQLSAAARPGTPEPPDRHPPRRRRIRPSPTTPSTSSASRISTCAASRLRAQGAAPPGASSGRAVALPGACRARGRGAVPRGGAARARGHRGQEGGVALSRGSLAGMAQGPLAQDGRLRRRGLHRTQGVARRLRRAAPRGLRERGAGVRRAGGKRIHREAARRGEREAHPRAGDADAACSGPLPAGKDTTWVEPMLVCEVEFSEWTEEGVLRQPVFLRFRDDKRVEECVRSRRAAKRCHPSERKHAKGCRPCRPGCAELRPVRRISSRPRAMPAGPATRPPSSSPTSQKVFWPEDGYTKGDLIEYYRAIAPWLLAISAEPASGAHALPRRDRRQVLLSEGRAGVRAGVDPDRADVERGHPAGDRLLHLRRRGLAAVRHQPGIHPAAPVVEPDLRRWSGRTGVCSISIRRAPRSSMWSRWRWRRRAAVPTDRAAAAGEDQRVHGTTPARPAGPAVHARAVAIAGGAAGAMPGRAAAEHRHHHAPGVAAGRAGVRGLSPERVGEADRGAVQRQAAARGAGVGAAPVAGGEPEPRHPSAHDSGRRPSG